MKIRFYDHVDDSVLKFAVIIAKYGDKWVFCKHKDRNTYELPGGHREAGESPAGTRKTVNGYKRRSTRLLSGAPLHDT